MKLVIRFVGLVMALVVVNQASALQFTCAGVIGNSGEQGAFLVKMTTDPAYRGHNTSIGMGVAVDKTGSLWTRFNEPVLARLSEDGRQYASFKIPPSCDPSDQITTVGDTVVLLIRGGVYTLSVNSTNGAAALPLPIRAAGISTVSHEGRLAAVGDNQLFMFDPVAGRQETLATIQDASQVEMDDAGSIYVITRANMFAREGCVHKFVGSYETTGNGWPKKWGYSRTVALQFVDGYFYLGGWFLSRLNRELEIDPGTILGMQGEFVIGVGGEWHADLGMVRGIVGLRPGLFAVAGGSGKIFILEWREGQKQMHISRCLGATPFCTTLEVNDKGDVFFDRVYEEWGDTPEIPSRSPPAKFANMTGYMTRLAPDVMVNLTSWAHGNSPVSFIVNSGKRFEQSKWIPREDGELAIDYNKPLPSVAFKRGKESFLLHFKADGSSGRLLKLFEKGQYRGMGPESALIPANGATLSHISSLGWNKGTGTLLAADGGFVIEFEADGDNWKEKGRWNSWGTASDETFGKAIWLAVDEDKLLVSDRDRHRVVCLDLASRKLLGTFGVTDSAGNTLDRLDCPERVAINGNRAVIFDKGNQRIVKLGIMK